MSNRTAGYTLVELIIVMLIIAIVVTIIFVFIPNAQRQARDTERQSDIDTLHSRLEDYYQDKGSYPSTISTTIFPRLDPDALKDPSGQSIRLDSPVADQAAARSSTNPDEAGPHYSYTPYPTGCTTNCIGYILKSFIETPSPKRPNPYISGGLNNN